nr:energy transducer TonB [Desulfobotulus pelophilus]
MEDIARQVEEGASRSLQRAFQDLERDVAERSRRQGRAGAGSEGLRGEAAGRVLDLYIAQAAHRVQQNWAYAGAGRSTEGAVVVFQITRDGRVRNLTVTQSSGNRLIDESARRAILKAEPFSVFPDTLPDDRIAIGFRFTDKGVDL